SRPFGLGGPIQPRTMAPRGRRCNDAVWLKPRGQPNTTTGLISSWTRTGSLRRASGACWRGSGAIRAGAPVGSRCQDGRSAGTRRKAAMAAIPVSIRRNVILSELGAPVGSRCQDGRSAGTRRKAAMAAIPVSIRPNVILSELFAISASAKTRRDRLARAETLIDQLKADLARPGDDPG